MQFNKTEALRRAEDHVSKREITAAIAIHRMIAQADPYDLTTINTLGELYVSAGRTKEAIDDFTRIADGYLNSGSGIKAAYLLRKVLDLDPSNAPVLIKLGEIYLREGMIDKAHDEFIRAGALLANEGQITAALQANHRALTAKPGSPQAKAAIAGLQADSTTPETALVGKPPQTGTRGLRSPSELDSIRAPQPAGPMQGSSADEESLIQQLSKAEMLVGYGEVDRAIALLNEVVSQSPDNLDVHGKLKDIYLRNEMIREAALECLELARIHEARGESARASEYTMRAGRLGHSSGHVVNHSAAQAPAEDAGLVNPFAIAPGRPGDALPDASQPKRLAETPSREQASTVSPTMRPGTVDPSVRHEAIPEPSVALPIILSSEEASTPVRRDPGVQAIDGLPVASPAPETSNALHPQKAPADRVTADLKVSVSETPRATPLVSERKLEPARTQSSWSALAAPSELVVRAPITAPFGKKPRWLPVAALALVGLMIVTLGAIKGVSMYGARLDEQYEELAVASAAGEPLSPPGLPSSHDLQAPADREAVKIDSPPVQVVTPNESATGQPIAAAKLSPSELEPKNNPALLGEQQRMNKPATASPPMVAVTDQRGVENLVPRGLPTGAPQTVALAPSPPPSAPTPQRAIPIIKGEAIRQAQPEYPAIARTARQEGTVPVEISINENGDVTSARAIAGPALLRGPAESAARRWKFKPSTRDGKPLPTVTTINFRFKL